MVKKKDDRIAILTRGVTGGGVQKMSVNLANQLVCMGFKVDFLSPKQGDNPTIDPRVNIILMRPSSNLVARWTCYKAAPDLSKVTFFPVIIPLLFPRSLLFVSDLAAYMEEYKPSALISATTYLNIAALLSKRLVKQKIKILISERTNLTETINSLKNRFSFRWRFVPNLIKHIYQESDAIISVSDGVGLDLAKVAGLSREKIRTINNPVLTVTRKEQQNRNDFMYPVKQVSTEPHFVVVGRLVSIKRIDLAINAFNLFLKKTDSGKLTIVGSGPKRKKLERMVRRLKLQEKISFIGWVDTSLKILKKADVCLLTSAREGSPNVLIEAMYCGCQIVATNCPNGPFEILKGGALGKLIDEADAELISDAMIDIIKNPMDKDLLLSRSLDYTAFESANQYLDSLDLL